MGFKTLAEYQETRKDISPQEWREVRESALSRLPLAEIRVKAGLTQAAMARALAKSQAAVSKFEGRGDFLLSTLYRHVGAAGGKVETTIQVGGTSFVLVPSTIDGNLVFSLKEATGGKQEEISLPELASQYRAGQTHTANAYAPRRWRNARKIVYCASTPNIGHESLVNAA